MSYYSRIIGTGSAFPERIMTNQEFEKFIETTDEWIRTRTGILARRVADPAKGETTNSISLLASQRALEMAGISGSELDCIIVGTVTPDTSMPTTGNVLQRNLGATGAFSFDMQAACSGFMYALSIADQYIRQGMVKKALVLGAEVLTKKLNWQDRATCVLFGDAAGAVVLTRETTSDHAILGTRLYSDGTKGDFLKFENNNITMLGSEIFKLAVRSMVDSSVNLLKELNLDQSAVDYYLFHQANIRILEMCMKTLDVPREKTWINLDKYGNTSAATLPTCLDEAVRAGQIKSGNTVLMTTFGGGVTWASGAFRY